VDIDLWDRVFRINVTALMRLTRAVVPLMLDAGTGSVVNIVPRPVRSGALNYVRTRERIGLHCRHKEGGFLNGGNAASHRGSE
jgi:hypothetical protein